jgi:uncharacterized protein YqgV (UPF0045/DUF77 family)
MLQCQLSLYPIATENYREIINKSILSLEKLNISYTLTSTCTILKGEDIDVFEAVKIFYEYVVKIHKENVLVAIYSNISGKWSDKK